jgi:hypothetical protein
LNCRPSGYESDEIIKAEFFGIIFLALKKAFIAKDFNSIGEQI